MPHEQPIESLEPLETPKFERAIEGLNRLRELTDMSERTPQEDQELGALTQELLENEVILPS